MRLPLRMLGLVAASLLIGSALAPASAQQQQSGVDGQVALRSDGALYVILNGQRRWVATTVLPDEQINAIPEGEPIYAGLAPMGQATTASSNPSKPSSGSNQQSNQSTNNSSRTSSQQSDDDDDDDDLSSDIPIEIDIEDSTTISRGEERKVVVKTRREVTCELTLRLVSNREINEDSKNANNQGRCQYTIAIPSNAATGNGAVIGTVREGGKMNRQEIRIKIVK